MVHATAARKVLEVGTYRGYSGIWLGLGLEQTGGRLITVDIDPAQVEESRGNFQRAGLAQRITGLEGDAHRVAKTVEGPLDLVSDTERNTNNHHNHRLQQTTHQPAQKEKIQKPKKKKKKKKEKEGRKEEKKKKKKKKKLAKKFLYFCIFVF